MDADKHVYEIFQAYPQWVYELLQRPSPGNCRFLSVAIKAIERRADGVLIPDAIDEPIWIIEIQLQWDAWIYNRIAVEMAMVQEEHEGREVRGAVIFGAKDLDPKTEPWCQIVSSFYLDTMLNELGNRSPGHPLVAVFQPLVEKNTDLLRQNAIKYYNQIDTFQSDAHLKSKLQDVFVDWLIQRFIDMVKTEVEQMLLGKLPDLRDTQTGKDLIAIGVEEGIEIGIEKGIGKGIEIGMEKGMEKGIDKGIEIGKIQILEQILSLPATESLEAYPIEELRVRLERLQQQIQLRNKGS